MILKSKYVYFVILMALSLSAIVYLMLDSAVSYIPVSQVVSSNGKPVQIYGQINPATVTTFNGTTNFTIFDDTGDLQAMYNKDIPLDSFDKNCVFIGSYNNSTKLFETSSILVKCPSKYSAE